MRISARSWVVARVVAWGLIAALSSLPRTATAASLVGTAGDIRIEVNKGRLVRLERAAASVFVADPEIADIQVKSPKLVYILAKKAGETSLIAVDQQERVLVNAKVTVNHNLSRLRDALGEVLPERSIEARSVAGAIVLSGSVASSRESEDARRVAARFVAEETAVINRLTVEQATQINLRVRIAEVSRSVIKEFGFNWDALGMSGNFILGLALGNPVAAAGTFLTRQGNANGLFGSFSNGTVDVNGILDALDDEGLISILAEPNLTAMSGETASFLAGGEFPVPVPQDQSRAITVEFKKFGVSLAFTPTVLDNRRINLVVRPEVSQLDTRGAVEISGFTIPALTTRRAETTVELASGQSFAIAGLLQNNTNHGISKFPGLGDVPVLGSLFRSDQFNRDESELVILVTPYLVRPIADPQAVALPNQGLVHPNDLQRILEGRFYREPLSGEQPGREQEGPGQEGTDGVPRAGLVGPAGFAFE